MIASRSILVSATAMALVASQACSSDDAARDVQNLTGTGGTTLVGAAGSVATPVAGAGGGSSSGGTSSAPSGAAGTEGFPPTAPPAAGGSANAGAGAAGAAGGMAVDGAMSGAGAAGAPTGMGGSTGNPVPPPETACPASPSPSNGVMCVITCTDGCGVHNLGARVCTCTNGAYACAACEFAEEHPLVTAPDAPLPSCDLVDEQQEDDESGCEENERCQSIGREDGSSGANRFCGCLDGEWDCDSKPADFP